MCRSVVVPPPRPASDGRLHQWLITGRWCSPAPPVVLAKATHRAASWRQEVLTTGNSEAAATTNGQVFENLLTERSVPTAYTGDASGLPVPGSWPGRWLQQRAAQCVSS